MCLRKGFEFLLQAFAHLWEAVQDASNAAAAATAAAGAESSGTGASSAPQQQQQQLPLAQLRPRITHVDQLWDTLPTNALLAAAADDRFSAKAVRRMVEKLAASNWQLLYEGLGAALTMRGDEIAAELLDAAQQWRSSGSEAEPGAALGAGSPASGGCGMACAGTSSSGSGGRADGRVLLAALRRMAAEEGAELAVAAEPEMLEAALCSSSSSSGGAGVGVGDGSRPSGAAAATPGSHLAAEHAQQPCTDPSRPELGLRLWRALLPCWERYHRWLELVVARCGPLGARVAAARQLLAPLGPAGALGGAHNLPHLQNKGLLVFRSQVR